jgi:hypothetical protein
MQSGGQDAGGAGEVHLTPAPLFAQRHRVATHGSRFDQEALVDQIAGRWAQTMENAPTKISPSSRPGGRTGMMKKINRRLPEISTVDALSAGKGSYRRNHDRERVAFVTEAGIAQRSPFAKDGLHRAVARGADKPSGRRRDQE